MPRIIIDRSLDDDVVAAASELPKHWSFVVRGDDGYYETDFLAPYVMNEKLAKRLEVKIDNWIQQYRNDDGILAKYQWLKARWDASKAEALERIKKGFNYQGPHNAKGGPHMD
ncbi:hypothetical protein SAMN05192571_11747 [Pleomorphomonas diazotrophica]|nr:hypothetical protein SAMN05192571_11747 [Pleomorphomonas diazotrophica]